MALNTWRKTALLSLAWFAFAGCEENPITPLDAGDAGPKDDGGPADVDVGQSPQEVELAFEARVGERPFDCNETFPALGTSQVKATLSDFRFFLYDARLINEAGEEVPIELTEDGEFQYQNVALLDFEDRTGSCLNGTPETNHAIKGTVKGGKYKGLRFGVGVPGDLNHGNPPQQPAPLNLSALAWPWLSGHVFLRIDARVEAAGGTPSFVIHLGSATCTGNPAAGQEVHCERPNRAEIELTNFDPERDKVVFDYAKLVAGVALDHDQGGESGCMAGASDPECQSIFGQLGIDAKTATPDSSAQTVFSAESK